MSTPHGQVAASLARHTCHCGKSFGRKEHLTRHQATHDQAAHVCNVCQRRFNRKELLRRHSQLHDPNRTRVIVSCDACRANKTKCSGGTPCSLCTRRGIDCVFRSNNYQSKSASMVDELDSMITTDQGNVDDATASPKSPRLESPPTTTTSLAERAPLGHDWLQDLSIIPSKAIPPDDFQLRSHGIEAIYELLLAEKPSLEIVTQVPDELQQWITKILDVYFKDFHLRWPVLNAPSFDAIAAPLPLAASVCVIGTWLSDNAEQGEKLRALQVHDIMLQRLLISLIDPQLMPQGKAWPIETLEAILLTLIFSLYRTNKNAVSGAMLLQNVFVTVLRDKGMFDNEQLTQHLRVHFTGTFAPYNISMREKFRRLLTLTYQYDAYSALMHEKPPMLHRQEIGMGLTATFALWNAHGLDVFAERLTEEPTDRAEFQTSAMMSHPGSFTSSQLLVEDVILGLCGMLQTIWVSRQLLPTEMAASLNSTCQRAFLIETLDTWKDGLDKIKRSTNIADITVGSARYLLLAYRGEDNSVEAILKRITTLVQDGMVLYYYLKLYHYISLDSSEFEVLMKVSQPTDIETCQTTKQGRDVIACMLQMLGVVDRMRLSEASINPLNRSALALVANLVRRLLASCKNCECVPKKVDYHAEVDLQSWKEGGGPLHIGDTQFCPCSLDFWTIQFEKAVQDHNIVMEPDYPSEN